MSSTSYVLLGAGGHARALIGTLQATGLAIHGLLDDAQALHGSLVFGHKVLGPLSLAKELANRHALVLALGSASLSSNLARQAIAEELLISLDASHFPVLPHPSAIVASHTSLEAGTQLQPRVVVQAGAAIGAFCILNTGAIVEHDSRLEAFVHLAPGAIVCGSAHIGQGTFIGAGSVVKQGVRVGAACELAAGSVLLHDIPDGTRVRGVPAQTY